MDATTHGLCIITIDCGHRELINDREPERCGQDKSQHQRYMDIVLSAATRTFLLSCKRQRSFLDLCVNLEPGVRTRINK